MDWDVPFQYGSPDAERDEDGYIVPLRVTVQEHLDNYLSGFQFHDSDVLYDLGCGTGEVLQQFLAAGCRRVIGIELNPGIVESCAQSVPHLDIRQGDIYEADLSDATIIFVYLGCTLPDLFVKLDALFEAGRLRLVISYKFKLLAFEHPFEQDQANEIYTYTK